MMNYSEDSRIDEFCCELALALRRITGLTPDILPGDLAQQVDGLPASEEDGDEGNDCGDGDDEKSTDQ
jgi:hypothetical protein